VVLQGIRIRFGRSLVTISGVALGIAFLMSIFTGQAIKAGVAEEEALRNEVSRMKGFLTAEMGPLDKRTIAVMQVGRLNAAEERLASSFLRRDGVSALRWTQLNTDASVPGLGDQLQRVELSSLGDGASAILVMGESGGAIEVDFEPLLEDARQEIVASTRRGREFPTVAGEVVMLEREMREEEIEEMKEREQRSSFRNTWIIVISLLVTVIGISNAMLMSVTERFREIGTMKCLGALSSFIRQIFLIESSLVGLSGAIVGALFGMVFSLVAYGFTYRFGLVLGSVDWLRLMISLLISIGVGVALSVLAAIYPANFASRMVPATALRTNI
jgi:ABC-type antimicrobial peptide transport system permease subunit